MLILINNSMDSSSIVEVLENILFWILVFYISWNENATPQWVFVLLMVFLVYFFIRFLLRKKGMERAVWIYTANMIVILYLFRKIMFTK
jgi:hypothetical protein